MAQSIGTFVCQMFVLLWKNTLLRKNQFCCVELFVLALYILLMVTLRQFFVPFTPLEVSRVENETASVPLTANSRKQFQEGFQGYILIGYAPVCSAGEQLMKRFRKILIKRGLPGYVIDVEIMGFPSEYTLVKYAKKYPKRLAYSYIFDPMTIQSVELPKQLKFIMRPTSDTDWMGRQGKPDYDSTGELYNMYLLMEAFTNIWSNKSYNLTVNTKMFSGHSMRTDPILVDIVILRIASYMVVATTFFIGRNVYTIAKERQSGVLAVYQRMGMNLVVYWLSWYLWMLIMSTLMSMVFVGTLLYPMLGNEPIFMLSDNLVVMFFFFTFSASLSAYCILGSVIHTEAKTCVATACFFHVSLIYMLRALTTQSWSRPALGLLVNLNLYFGLLVFAAAERSGCGVKWKNIGYNSSPFTMNFTHFETMKAISSLLYLFLAYLCYNMIHTPSPFWKKLRGSQQATASPALDDKQLDPKLFQEDPKQCEPAIVFSKVFSLNCEEPLANINYKIFENQITALVSNAGHVCLCDILKGEIVPTRGTVKVFGKDIVRDIVEIKKMTGVCTRLLPDYYSMLTVKENLKLFTRLKALCQGKKAADVNKLAVDFHLDSVLKKRVCDLKPSDKRMVQVALAASGFIKILILEEPTQDMDAVSKHRIGNILCRLKKDMTIVVTTNSTELAEMIGDRIAFFAGIHLVCAGSVSFLRALLGAGYYLTINLANKKSARRIKKEVATHIPSALLLEDTMKVQNYLLPLNATSGFSALFTYFEENKQELSLENFSVEAKTLEECFQRISDTNWRVLLTSPRSENTIISQVAPPPKIIRDRMCSVQEGYDFFNLYSLGVHAGTSVDDLLDEFEKNRDMTAPASAKIHDMFSGAIALNEDKCTGVHLWFLRVGSLVWKNIMLNYRNAYIELAQILLLIALAYAGSSVEVVDEDDNYLTHELGLNPFDYFPVSKFFVLASQGSTRSPTTESLFKCYRTVVQANQPFDLQEFDILQKTFENVLAEQVFWEPHPKFGVVFNASEQKPTALSGTAYYSYTNILRHRELPISVSAVMNAFLCHVMGSSEYRIAASILPVHLDKKRDWRPYKYTVAYDMPQHFVFLITVTLFSVPYMLAIENHAGLRRMQYINGVGPLMYWTVQFLYDLVNYSFLSYVFAAFTLVFHSGELAYHKVLFALVLLSNGVMMLPFTYVIQRLFTSPHMAVVVMTLLNYILSEMGNMAEVFIDNELNLICNNDAYMAIQLLLPSHLMPNSLCNIIQNHRGRRFCEAHYKYCQSPQHSMYEAVCCNDVCEGEFNCNMFFGHPYLGVKLPGIGLYVCAMLAHAVFWFLILALLEYRILQVVGVKVKNLASQIFSRCRKDVIQGASGATTPSLIHFQTQNNFKLSVNESFPFGFDRVVQDNTDEIIIFQNVSKFRKQTFGLSNLNFSIDRGDLFCLVCSEPNTTSLILDLMCGRKFPDSGVINFDHSPLHKHFVKPIPELGYCPSQDTNFPFMTGKETLWFYATLKGIRQVNIKLLIYEFLKTFRLRHLANVPTKNYGLAERRRLSLATAMIGNPDILVLDGTSTGMDAKSIELFKGILSSLIRQGKSVIITSNNIEEYSSIANRVALIVNGMLVCLGQPSAIRKYYCNSYTLLAKIDSLNDSVSTSILVDSLRQRFANAALFHDQMDFVHVQIPYESHSLADIFSLMESTKKHLKIRDYTLRHTKLNHVMYAFEKALKESHDVPLDKYNGSIDNLKKWVNENVKLGRECNEYSERVG